MLHTVKNYALVVVAVAALATIGISSSLAAQDNKDQKKGSSGQKDSESQKSKSTAKPSAGKAAAKKQAADPDKVSDERMSTRGMHKGGASDKQQKGDK